MKSLDGDVYRNLEFDVWQDTCKGSRPNINEQLEALGERRPGAGAFAKTCFNLAFRLYRRERHQNLISSSLFSINA